MIETMLDRMEAELKASFFRIGSPWTYFRTTRSDHGGSLTFTSSAVQPDGRPTALKYEWSRDQAGAVSLFWTIASIPDPTANDTREFLWIDGLKDFSVRFLNEGAEAEDWDASGAGLLPSAVKIDLVTSTAGSFTRLVIIPSGGGWHER
jgi:hypothetical protein